MQFLYLAEFARNIGLGTDGLEGTLPEGPAPRASQLLTLLESRHSVNDSMIAGLWFDKAEAATGADDLPRRPVPRIFERRILALSDQHRPKVAMLATASGDSDLDVATFYRRMSHLDCHPSDLSIVRYNYPDFEALIRQQDVLYIGDGSAPNLVAIWRANGLDEEIRERALSGIPLYAEREGAAALFDAYDSCATGRSEIFHDGLGILKGTLIRCFTKEDVPIRDLPKPIYVVQPVVAMEFRASRGPYVVPSGNNGHAWRCQESSFIELPIGLL